MGYYYVIYSYTSRQDPNLYFAGPVWDQAVQNQFGNESVSVVTYHTGGQNYIRFEKDTPFVSDDKSKAGIILQQFANGVIFVNSN